MKKKNPFFVLLLVAVICSMACRFHGHTRTVKVNSNDSYLKIEYCGDVSFSDDGSAIEYISPDGYVKYNRNGQKIYIEGNEDGTPYYKFYNGSHRLNSDDPETIAFMNQAIKEMEEHYGR